MTPSSAHHGIFLGFSARDSRLASALVAISGLLGLSCSGVGVQAGSGGVGGASGATAGGSAGVATGVGGSGGAGLGGSAAGGAAGSDMGGSAGDAGVAGSQDGLGGAGADAGGSAGVAAGGGSMGGSSGMGGGPTGSDRSVEGTCARWNADRADLSEGTWSGNVDNCVVGDISADGRANALRQFNLYRWLADLPAVETSEERDRWAQACALLQDANSGLSHEPPMSWNCWSEDGAQGSRTSNISGGPGVSSVQAYMLDFGNESTHGHRRWILSNSLGPIGLGSTGNGSSCMQNIGGDGDAGKEWLAWPPPGVFPFEAYSVGNRGSYDDTGWSFQSEDIDLDNAAVTVTSNGAELAVQMRHLDGRYGNADGIAFDPSGWSAEPGNTYIVTVSGITPEISYEVQVVSCQ